MTRTIIVVVTFLLFGVAQAQIDAETRVLNGAVRIFGQGCLQSYPEQEKFQQWVTANKLELVTGFAKTTEGQAYSINDNGVQYLLVAEDNNLCTVFVKKANFEKVQDALSPLLAELESLSTQYLVSKPGGQKPPKATETIRHEYYNSAMEVFLRIIITQSHTTDDFFQLAISAISKAWVRKSHAE